MTHRGPSQHDAWPEELALDASPGPATPLTRAAAEALIDGALAEAGYVEVARPLPRPDQAVGPAPAARRRLLPVAAALALACLGVGSASAAVMWWIERPAPAAIPQPAVEAKPRLRPRPAPAPAIASEEPPVQPVDEPAPRRAAERRAPEDWLQEANRLRAERRWQAADQAYARVWQSDPDSPAAYVARIAAAGVRLEHQGDPRGALARYRAALAQSPQGALSEEARFGIAEAQRALGDASREREALAAFLAAHPESGLASKARTRLAELDAAGQKAP